MDISDYNFVSHLKILQEKQKLRSKINGINIKGTGKCIHVGKIAPGCKSCFMQQTSKSLALGIKCNLNCKYCLNKEHSPITEKQVYNQLSDIFRRTLEDSFVPAGFAFTNGEPLLYMDRMEKFGELFLKIEKEKGVKLWNKIYTNGLLFTEEKFDKLEKWHIQEIRFHPSASGFSDTVLKNMEIANERGFVVAVEEPAYPPNQKELFKHLPIFENLGVKHLQLCEPKVFASTIDDVVDEFPDARFYLTNRPFLYHEGLTYEIMEKVIEKDYSFSVLDCSAELWSWQHKRTGNAKKAQIDDLDKIFADYSS